jgi:nitrate reductase gamma subunit
MKAHPELMGNNMYIGGGIVGLLLVIALVLYIVRRA